jgi:hypothetical protein
MGVGTGHQIFMLRIFKEMKKKMELKWLRDELKCIGNGIRENNWIHRGEGML